MNVNASVEKQESFFRYSMRTMGCKANIYDSLVIERELMELGGKKNDDNPDVFIVNSCTVTAEADKQSLKEIQNAHKRNPNAITIMTGCSAEVSAERLYEDSSIQHVIPNHAKKHLRSVVAQRLGLTIPLSVSEESREVYWGQLPSFAGRTRAFLKIQEGCNDFCTYCIIPYARGKSRSVAKEHIFLEVDRLIANGIREVVITGTNIADWGKDFGATLEDLLEDLLERTKVPRIRLTSLDPSEITPRLLELAKNDPRIMPHFHISLQSPVSRVLRAMKRTYRTEDVESALVSIRELGADVFVGMDVISGFPSETEDEHKEGLEILKSLPWTRLHVFPYSEREGTPALKIAGSVPMHTRKERAKELMNLSDQRHEAFAKTFIGKTVRSALFETAHTATVASDEHGYIVGHAPNYSRVMASVPRGSQPKDFLNHIFDVEIDDILPKPQRDWTLVGRICV